MQLSITSQWHNYFASFIAEFTIEFAKYALIYVQQLFLRTMILAVNMLNRSFANPRSEGLFSWAREARSCVNVSHIYTILYNPFFCGIPWLKHQFRKARRRVLWTTFRWKRWECCHEDRRAAQWGKIWCITCDYI